MIEKTARNEKIFNEKEAGATYRELSTTYGLSINALFAIVKRYRERRKNA